MITFGLLLIAIGVAIAGWIFRDVRRLAREDQKMTERIIARKREEMLAKMEAERYAHMPWPLTEGWLQEQAIGQVEPSGAEDFIVDLDRLINNVMWDRLAEQEGPRGIISITNGEPRRPPMSVVEEADTMAKVRSIR